MVRISRMPCRRSCRAPLILRLKMDYLIDIVYSGGILLLFLLCWAFARGCQRLEGK